MPSQAARGTPLCTYERRYAHVAVRFYVPVCRPAVMMTVVPVSIHSRRKAFKVWAVTSGTGTRNVIYIYIYIYIYI